MFLRKKVNLISEELAGLRCYVNKEIRELFDRLDKKIKMLCKCEHGFKFSESEKVVLAPRGPCVYQSNKHKECVVCGKREYLTDEEYDIQKGKQLLEKHGYDIED